MAPDSEGLRVLEGSPAYYFGLGDLLREWNDLEAAERHLAQGMDLVAGTLAIDADVITLGHIAMARLQQARAASDRASETLDRFLDLARRRRFVADLIRRAAAAQAQLWLAQGNFAAAGRWAAASGLHPDDEPSYPREAEHLALARVLIAQGRGDPADKALHDALQLLDRLLADAEAKARMHSAIEILTLQALAYVALADHSRALRVLHRALALAEPEDYIRIFVDEGAPMRLLLADSSLQLAARALPSAEADATRVLAYVERLLAAFPDAGRSTEDEAVRRSSVLVEPLTERELEILRLVAAGASNREIAERLIVALGTVKKHLNNAFGKLAVQSRTQALARAHELGLL